MALYFNKTLENGLKIVVWTLTETLEELTYKVQLCAADVATYQSISIEAKRREFLAGKYVLQKACEIYDLPFYGVEKDDHGKPYLIESTYEVSLTHTDKFIAVVLSDHQPVGIDLEMPREKIFRVLPRLFSESEVKAVNGDLHKATIYWSAKEALYKLYGKRSLNFKHHMLIKENNGNLEGSIVLDNYKSHHQLIVEEVEAYYLVIAY